MAELKRGTGNIAVEYADAYKLAFHTEEVYK